MVKHILASGCSFAAGGTNHQYEDTINCWPTRLSQLLDCDVTNLAHSGAGNTWIVDSVIKELCNNPNKYDLVVIGWTEAFRMSFPNTNVQSTYATIQPLRVYDELAIRRQDLSYLNGGPDHYLSSRALFALGVVGQIFKNYDNPNFAIEDRKVEQWPQIKLWFDRWLIDILSLQNFLEGQKIPYIFGQATDVMSTTHTFGVTWDDIQKQLTKHIFKSKLVENITYENWVNFPPEPSHMTEMVLEDTVVSNVDAHPNLIGHKNIAKSYYNRYNKIYGS